MYCTAFSKGKNPEEKKGLMQVIYKNNSMKIPN